MNAQKHPVYWFDDGSLVLHVQDTVYKIHGSLLKRHSPYLALVGDASSTTAPLDPITSEFIGTGISYVRLGPERPARPDDVEALLEHLYHDFCRSERLRLAFFLDIVNIELFDPTDDLIAVTSPLGPGSSLNRAFSVLRSSSPTQLDFPTLHALAKECLDMLFTLKTSSQLQLEHLCEGLVIAKDFGLLHVQRIALYQTMILANLDPEDQDSEVPDQTSLNPPHPSSPPSAALGICTSPPGCRYPLGEADRQLCKHLMTRIIEYFTPILFTPPTTPHMPCTDVFANTWMTLVIQPAIDNGGVYKPMETLERIKEIDWAKQGLCSACVVEKREEWREEQDSTWSLVGRWLKEGSVYL